MTTINWNALGINEITNLYLYGDLSTPANLQDEALTHRASANPIDITLTDVASFMTDGPGRLANGAQSTLVNLFMSGASSLDEALAESRGLGLRILDCIKATRYLRSWHNNLKVGNETIGDDE